MTNAIYATTGSEDWPGAAKKLEDIHEIHPSYWVTHKLKEKVDNKFEHTIIHDSHEAMKGHPAEKYDSKSQYYSLNSEILSDFREYEVIALQMMERLDNLNRTGGDPGYRERIKLYYRQLSYWRHVIDDIDPDLAIFGSTPHIVYDYILYAVCVNSDIKTVICTHTNLPGRFCVRNEINEEPIRINDLNKSNQNISKEANEYVEKLRSEYSKAEPEYMRQDTQNIKNKKIKNLYSVMGQSSNLLSDFLRVLRRKALNKIISKDSEDTSMKQKILTRVRPMYHRRKLRSQYEDQVTNPDYGSKYIYFPLHYQPERTTSPEGGRYVHQYLAIDRLSSFLPNDIQIFVKEHPSQFSSRLKGERGRSAQYYTDLCEIPNVSMVPLNSDPFKLIDNSEAIATITGTAGWEALVRGKPAIIFGNAWYRSAPGCHYINNINSTDTLIENIINSDGASRDLIKKYISVVESNSYLGSLNSTSEKNVDSFVQAICDSI
jgi:hypothetical protein